MRNVIFENNSGRGHTSEFTTVISQTIVKLSYHGQKGKSISNSARVLAN